MILIDAITVRHRGQDRSVSVSVGDLTRLPEPVDLLVVSAFPDNYVPLPRTLIGALNGIGVSVADLARNKAVDLRGTSSCWLSQPIDRPGVPFGRILCFKPRVRGRAAEVVGDIFRSLIPFTMDGPPLGRIAMPLVATGSRGEPPEAMLEALVDAGVHWLGAGLDVDRIDVVLRPEAVTPAMWAAFARVRVRHAAAGAGGPKPFDAFISYSQQNKAAVDPFVARLRAHRPGLRVFMDRLELDTGAAWQQHIWDALEVARKIVCLYSPVYLASPICQEEYNIARIRHRESGGQVILPVFLHDAALPAHMRVIQYTDAREGGPAELAKAAADLAARI